MDLKLLIEVCVLGVTVLGAWFGLRYQVESLKASINELKETVDDDLCTRLTRFEESGVIATATRAENGSMALHRRVDEHEGRLIGLERDFANQSKAMADAMARLESAVSNLGGLLQGQIANLQKRIDDALASRRP